MKKIDPLKKIGTTIPAYSPNPEYFIELEGGECLTEHHLILTDKGWIKASDLTTKTKVISGDGKVVKIISIKKIKPIGKTK